MGFHVHVGYRAVSVGDCSQAEEESVSRLVVRTVANILGAVSDGKQTAQ